MSHWKGSLRTQLTASFLAVAVLPAVAGGIAALVAVTSLRQSIAERNLQVARAVAGEVGRFLDSQRVHLQELALARARGEARTGLGFVEQANLHLAANAGLQALVLLDGDARALAVVPANPDVEGIDFSAQPFVREARLRREPTWSSATISLRTGLPVVALVIPGDGFLVVGYVDLSAALTSIVDRTRVGRSGNAAIVDRTGAILAHPQQRLVRQQVNVRDVDLVVRALGGEEATAEYDFEGQRLLGSVSPVPQTNWVVLASEPAASALGPLYRLRALLLVVLGVAILVAILAGVVSARRILRPLAELTAQTHRLAAGQVGEAPPGPAAAGPREIGELAADFAAMAAAVRAREGELRASEERFRTMSSIGTEGVMLHAGGVILDANLAFARLAGHPDPSDLIGRPGLEVLPLTPASLEAVRGHLRSPDEGAYEIQLRGPDGSLVDAETSGKAVVYRGLEARLVTLRDISLRKKMEAERARLESSLQHAQKMDSIGMLAGGVAHDFNNSLSVILSCAEALSGAVPDAHRPDLEAITSAARSSAALTRRLLSFARHEPAATRPVEVGPVVRALADMLRRTLPRSIAVAAETPAGDGELVVLGDRSELEHALLNLGLNARDAMPGGGKLTLRCRERVLQPADVATRPGLAAGRVVQIDVEDTGSGIPPEVLPRIFEPLFTTKPADQGTGLGLSSVYGIVRSHRGAIDVYTEVGKGTRFALLLPAAAETARAEALPRRRRGVAIVADDNPAQRAAARRCALALFEAVLEAADGAEALEQLEQRNGQVAALIADLDMPGQTGGQLAAAVRERWPGVTVVVTSGLHRDLGGLPFLRKPFSVAELDAIL